MSYDALTKEQLIVELERVKKELDSLKADQKKRGHIEERFLLAMKACKDGIWDWNIESRESYYSPGYNAILGYDADQFPDDVSGWLEHMHPDDIEAVLAAIYACIHDNSESFCVEFRMQARSGKWIWILGRGQVVQRNMDGKAQRMVGTHSDITQIKESENYYRSVYETVSAAIVTISMQGQYLSWNPVWCEMLGYSAAEMKNINAFDITHHDDLDQGARNVASLILGEVKSYRQEKRFIKKDGSILWVDLSAAPLKNSNGEVEALLGVIIDISRRKMVEAAMASTEERYSNLVHRISSGVAVYEAVDGGVDFIFKDFNPAAEEMTLISREQALGSTLLQLFPAIKNSSLHSALQRVWSTGVPEKLPPFFYKDSMREGWRENRLYKLPSGEVVSLFDDVTRRINATKALEASEQRLNLALNAVNDAVWDWKIDTGEVYFSPRWFTMLGFEPDELPQGFETWEKLLHPEDKVRATAKVKAYLKSGESFKVEMRMRTKGNQWRWILGRGMVVETDLSGRAIRMIGTHVDITDRIQATEALRESEQRFRNLLENVEMVAVRGYDENKRIIYWNRACEALYGYSRAEVIGLRGEEFIFPEDQRAAIDHMLTSWITEGIPFPSGEFTLQHKNGSPLSVYSSNAMQVNAQGNRELYFVDVDLTEIQLAYSELIEAKEQAEAASRAKSLFLANMSHELRTPLNGIMGVHHILESTSLDDKQQEYLSLAQGSARRLTNLLNDILDLTRVEAGCMELKNTSFSLAEALHETEQLFQAASGQEDVECRFHVDPEIPKKLIGDPSRLQQILNNIVGNAIKFTAAGKIEISVSLLPNRSGDECKLLFSISDTGIGIPEEKLDSIFNSFTQVDDSFTRTHQGAGLGLSIVKRLVGLMGGNMSVESRIGMGTTFYLCLPFQVETKTTAIELPASQDGLQVSPGRIKALLVEDDVISQMVFQKLLEKEGCEVMTANDGIQAIQILNKQIFDVVFMDVQMPVMDGVTATKAIRNGEAGEQSMNTMLIATTAYAMTGDKEMLLQAGMDGYIEKPIAVESLQQVLMRVRNAMCN